MDKPIRVLHVCGALTSNGGVGAFLVNHYRNIDRDKIQFDFLTHTHTDQALVKEITEMGGKVYQITPKSINFIKNIIDSRKIINSNLPHKVIHIHSASTTSFLYLWLAKLAGKKMRIIHSHATGLEKKDGSFQHKVHKLLQPLLIKNATHLFTCSIAAGEWLFGKKNGQAIVINNAINLREYNYVDSEKTKKNLEIENKLVVGSIGRLTDVKNPEFTIDIFKEIKKIKPNSILLMVGAGELEDKLKDKVNHLGLSEDVLFLGVRKDVPELLSTMDLFLLPSLFEGLPVILIEAQASGIPIFASDTITDEVEITDLITRLPLSKSPYYWAKLMLDDCQRPKRYSRIRELNLLGYDIVGNSKKLVQLYLQGLE